MNRLQSAKEAFVRAGGLLSDRATRGALVRADHEARKQAESFTAPPNKVAAEWIVWGLGWLAVIFFFAVLLIGVGLLLLVIPAAEAVAVYAGLFAITPIPWIAGLTTAALFIGIVVLMFLKHVYEDALPDGRPATGLTRKYHALMAWLGSGRSAAWVEQNPLLKVERDYLFLDASLSGAKFAIIGASLVGRLARVLTAHGGKPLAEALDGLRTTLTGTEAVDIIVSLVVLYALLKMLDMGVLFSYTAFKNSAGKLDLAEVRPVDFLSLYSALKEEKQAEALEDLAIQLEAQKPSENS